MQIGSQVQVKAYKSDGSCYRWWTATVEAVGPDLIVTTTPAGHWVHNSDGGWRSKWAIRSYYWPDRWYSVLEVYLPAGELVEIYVNINSPVEFGDAELCYTDYELDVSREPPAQARLVDEDEFQEAASKYGYTAEFQQTCYRVAKVALEVADNWVANCRSESRQRACNLRVLAQRYNRPRVLAILERYEDLGGAEVAA